MRFVIKIGSINEDTKDGTIN